MSIKITNRDRHRRAFMIIGFIFWMIPTIKTIRTDISPVIDFDTFFMTVSFSIAIYLVTTKEND